MITPAGNLRMFPLAGPVDFRKGMEGLAGIVASRCQRWSCRQPPKMRRSASLAVSADGETRRLADCSTRSFIIVSAIPSSSTTKWKRPGVRHRQRRRRSVCQNPCYPCWNRLAPRPAQYDAGAGGGRGVLPDLWLEQFFLRLHNYPDPAGAGFHRGAEPLSHAMVVAVGHTPGGAGLCGREVPLKRRPCRGGALMLQLTEQGVPHPGCGQPCVQPRADHAFGSYRGRQDHAASGHCRACSAAGRDLFQRRQLVAPAAMAAASGDGDAAVHQLSASGCAGQSGLAAGPARYPAWGCARDRARHAGAGRPIANCVLPPPRSCQAGCSNGWLFPARWSKRRRSSS